MRDVAVNSRTLDWSQTKWEGIYRKVLRNDQKTGARAVLLKLEPDSRLPKHLHPGGEEVYVLDGRVRFENEWYEQGYYLYSPPGSSDDVYTEAGAVLFVSLPNMSIDIVFAGPMHVPSPGPAFAEGIARLSDRFYVRIHTLPPFIG